MADATKTEPTFRELISDHEADPTPGHDSWFREEVQKALDDKAANGDAGYVDHRKFFASVNRAR